MWVKRRDGTADWQVFHKGLNGGTDPEDYVIKLNTTSDDSDSKARWDDTAPTSPHFTLGDDGTVNGNGNDFIVMLFASTDVSKVGYYTGNGTGQTITTGFQPRLIIIKRTTAARDWLLFDTVRGIGPGANDDKVLFPNSDIAQESQNFVDLTATGFTLVANLQDTNHQDHKYIYYAHA